MKSKLFATGGNGPRGDGPADDDTDPVDNGGTFAPKKSPAPDSDPAPVPAAPQ